MICIEKCKILILLGSFYDLLSEIINSTQNSKSLAMRFCDNPIYKTNKLLIYFMENLYRGAVKGVRRVRPNLWKFDSGCDAPLQGMPILYLWK